MTMRPVRESGVEARLVELRNRFPTERSIDEVLSSKMRKRKDPPYRPQDEEDVVLRVSAFLRRRLGSSVSVSEMTGLAGGSSKEQFSFQLSWTDSDGATHIERLVLRMRPAESIVETHPMREFQAIRAATGTLPVPRLRWIDPDGEELGRPAMIYSYVDGVSKPPFEGAYTPKSNFSRKYRERIYPQFVQYFAKLARLAWSATEMDAFHAPAAGSNEGVIKVLNWWDRVWAEDAIEAFPLMTLTSDWLRRNAPVIDHVSLVHSDFRGGNFLFDPRTCEINAFLDWELALLGDRHMDLAFFMSPMFYGEDEETGESLLGGLVPRQRFIDDYERLSGLPVDQERLDYYTVFNNWRAAIISMATAPRVVMGQKSHQDIRVGWIAGVGPISCGDMQRHLEAVYR